MTAGTDPAPLLADEQADRNWQDGARRSVEGAALGHREHYVAYASLLPGEAARERPSRSWPVPRPLRLGEAVSLTGDPLAGNDPVAEVRRSYRGNTR